ncbi:MAG: hypothetical protein IJH94_02565 [Clostridia bacterium]|nr:hypothetical protein [Clostridia bacterium]
MTEAGINDWKKLYEISSKLKEIKPWERLWDADIITIQQEDSEPCYCTIMGRAGECYGIGIYQGSDGLTRFMDIMDSRDMPPLQIVRHQKCLAVYWGDRAELYKKELDIIKELGYRFRGKNQWLYFRSFNPPYAPYILSKEEVVFLTEILTQLYEALCEYKENNISVDFENQQILLRSCVNGIWETNASEIELEYRTYPCFAINDDVFMRKMQAAKSIRSEIEIDVAYLHGQIKDKSSKKPAFIRCALIADRKAEQIIHQDMPTPDVDDDNVLANLFVNYIINMGKPKKIFVRDERNAHIISEFCEKLNVPVYISPCLDVIDDVVDFIDMRMQ